MRCQNLVKRREISNAIPNTLFCQCFYQFWSQTRKPKIPDEEFQSDTPRSAKPRKFKKRREISNVGWSQELTEVFGGHSCGKIAVCQQCRERQPLSNSHNGLNLTCLNRCDGVRSHGTSSSQGWHKRSVVQSELDPWVYILVIAAGNLCRFAQESFPTKACLCGHQCFSVVAQGTAKIRPRAIFQMNERWRRRRCKRIRSMGLHPLFSTKVIYDPCNY